MCELFYSILIMKRDGVTIFDDNIEVCPKYVPLEDDILSSLQSFTIHENLRSDLIEHLYQSNQMNYYFLFINKTLL